ncbi:MAG: sugar ABC transporter permease [Clostridiales bacterium]|nr:sugar ABC transporter permease [Clostridiales bacterium]
MVKWFKKNWVGYFFLSPWLIGLLVFTIIPIFVSLYLSFTDYNILTPPKFIGLGNYKAMFNDRAFKTSLIVTFKFVFIGVPLKLAFALFIAVLLNRKIGGLKIYRAVYYIPSLLGSSVAVSILWRQIFNKEGLFNIVLSKFGIQGINWIATPSTALYTIILLNVWEFGSSMLIFLSALKQVPMELYESAMIDGASRRQRFFKITIPMITPMIFFNMIMQFINAFQSFNSAYIISGGNGGPMDSTLLFSLYLYQKGFSFFKMGYASAMAWFLLGIIAIMTLIQFKLSNKWVYNQDE